MSNDFEFYRDLPKRKKNSDKGSVEPVDVQGSRLIDNHQRARERSVASDSVKPTPRKKTKVVKIPKSLLVLAFVVVIVTSSLATLGVNQLVDQVQTNIAVTEFNDEMGVRDALNDAFWSRIDKDGRVWGYNHNTLADYVDGRGKYEGCHNSPDKALFALHSEISQRKTENMDAVVKQIVGDYKSWDDYLSKHGFVDKNGNPSDDVYKTEMPIRIAQGQFNQNFDQKHGMKR